MDQLTIAGKAYSSRLLVGTGKYKDFAETRAAIDASGAEIDAGGGTVSGTVGKVAANWFVLSDGEREIPVTSRAFLPDGIQSGEQITVVGGIRRGAIQAKQIIRQDGTAFGRDAFQDRRSRHHDD